MTVSYSSGGKSYALELTSLSDVAGAQHARARPMLVGRGVRARAASGAPIDAGTMLPALAASAFMKQRIRTDDSGSVMVAVRSARRGARRPGAPVAATTMIATRTLIVEGARSADLKAARDAGAHVIHEGLDGKALLQCDDVAQVFTVAKMLVERQVGAAVPNFLRRVSRLPQSAPSRPWAHAKIGVAAAWKITKGRPDVRVAVLDEGVDTSHPALRAAVVGAKDFIGGNGDSAMPDGDDAHGTACAGIVVSRDKVVRGVAPNCSLLAGRIAMGDGTPNGWVFDDYATADAVDWAWRNGAAVISNSWGGGLPSDAISRAFGRARTQGRDGKGALVVIAAGNSQEPVDFPGDLPGYVTVGASTPRDEWKSRTSSDGERWGSNYGPTLWVLAPGVFIWTTDIAGPRGDDAGDFTKTFNGTSAATPHVAGAAALMFSANPALTASEARDILKRTATLVPGQTGWTEKEGWGRLHVGRAVKAARK